MKLVTKVIVLKADGIMNALDNEVVNAISNGDDKNISDYFLDKYVVLRNKIVKNAVLDCLVHELGYICSTHPDIPINSTCNFIKTTKDLLYSELILSFKALKININKPISVSIEIVDDNIHIFIYRFKKGN